MAAQATQAHLSNAVINLSVFREYGRKELTDLLDSVPGKKGLVLDPKFSGPLGLVAEVKLLQEHGVEKIYHLVPGALHTECKTLLYLVRPKVEHMRHIAEHIHAHTSSGQKKQYSVFFVPRRTMICERVLEELGVYGDVTVGEYQLDLIPFDEDVLSLELEFSYKECFLDGDKTSLFYVARSLMKLQSIFGIIPHIKGKGSCSKLVMDMLMRMRREMGMEENSVVPEIDTLILMDRQTDMITPMCTQLTYEGIMDEVMHINNTFVDLEPEIVGAEKSDKRVKYALNSNDKLYGELRDLNFSVLGPTLNQKAKDIGEYYKKRHDAQTLGQIRDFMKNLGSYQSDHQSLRIHTNIAEKILGVTNEQDFLSRLEAEQSLLAETESALPYVEECIARQEPLLKVLRLLVLESLINNGIKSKMFDHMRREILQTYGHEHVHTLSNLERLNLLVRQDGRGSYSALRKGLRLIVEDVSLSNPTDLAYVYSGYAPLSVRLIQCCCRYDGWRNVEDLLKTLPGPAFEAEQTLPSGVQQLVADGEGTTGRVTLVFFIGGVTFTEISALRFLQLQEEGKRDFIIATTKLINGSTLLQPLTEQAEAIQQAINPTMDAPM